MATVTLPPLEFIPQMAYLHVTLSDGTDELNFPKRFTLQDGERRFRVGPYRGGVGNSSVFEGRELDSRSAVIRTCAIKMQRVLTPSRRMRFLNDVRMHSRVDHLRVASFYGSGAWLPNDRAYDVPWAAMDLGGLNLYRSVIDSGPLEPRLFRSVALQVTDAVGALHELEIIHRDIKPSNFVWAFHEKTDNVKMIDFGIAKLLNEDLESRKLEPYVTETMEFVGPQNFASPELLLYGRDKKTVVDQRSDLFQLGLLFWFLATGRILTGIPDEDYDPTGGEIQKLVFDLTRENPAKRPQTAAEVTARLRQLKS